MMDFVVDPPIRVGGLNMTPIGVRFIEKNGVWHVIDWVGEEHYPNVADFVEETRVHGVSRRLPSMLEFEKLTPESRLLLVHRRAWVNQRSPYYVRRSLMPECPRSLLGHARGLMQGSRNPPMCAGLWWRDLVGGEDAGHGVSRRRTPSVRYDGVKRPEGLSDPGYEPAVFMSVPMTNLAVIHDSVGNRHERAMERLEGIENVYLVPR